MVLCGKSWAKLGLSKDLSHILHVEYILKQELVVVQTPESKAKMQLKDFLIRAEGNTELFWVVVV